MLKELKLQLSGFFSSRVPSLGIIKRWLSAFYHSYSRKKSYSQHGEDLIIYSLLKDKNLENGIYIDVGANHPTSISNSYLFYRKGLHGVTIEPNPELIGLHRQFRKKDISLAIALAEKPALAKFNITKAPVLSSFSSVDRHLFWKDLYVPILTLDDVTSGLKIDWIYFLSIDVEGLNYSVLLGAEKTLAKTFLLCIEMDNEAEKIKTTEFLTKNHFEFFQQAGCNLIFKNSLMN